MAPKKIVVFGVTGVQGGSVARYLLEDGKDKFDVWGVSRSKTSAKAKELEKAGVTIVEADLDDPKTYEAALKGADNVWVNANFWLYYDGTNPDEAAAHEVQQNKDVIDAAIRQGVPHITFSAVRDFGDKFPVPHADSKVTIVKYLEKLGHDHALVYAPWFWTNVLLFPRRKEGDKWVVSWPVPDNSQIPGFDPEQVGAYARLVFRDPAAWSGKKIFCASDLVSPVEQAAALSEVLGVEVVPHGLTREGFDSPEFQAQLPHELVLNYKAILSVENSKPEQARKLYPEAYYFKEWVAKTPELAKAFTK